MHVLIFSIQVYLERTPGSNTGCIKWRINFGCCGLLVDEVTIRLLCVEEYGGEVLVTLTGSPGEKRVRYPIGKNPNCDIQTEKRSLNGQPWLNNLPTYLPTYLPSYLPTYLPSNLYVIQETE